MALERIFVNLFRKEKVQTANIDNIVPVEESNIQSENQPSKAELEQAMLDNTIVLNSIDKARRIIRHAGYTILGEDDADVKVVQDFFKNVGKYTKLYSFHKMVGRIVLDQFLFGEAYMELVESVSGDLVDLNMLDPKKIDFARDIDGNIIYENTLPIGYVYSLNEDTVVEQKYEVPEQVELSANQLYLPLDKVVRFTLIDLPDGISCTGLIKPAYKSIMRQKELEKAITNSIRRLGFPILVAKVGDEYHIPTEQQLTEMLNKLVKHNYRYVYSVPYYNNLEIIQAKEPESMSKHLSYFIDNHVTAMGAPKPIATGSGEATNRSTLNVQTALYKITLQDIANELAETIQKYVVNRLIEENNLSEVKFVWNSISIEELNDKSTRLAKYVSANLLTPTEELEKYIRKVEDLPNKPQTKQKDEEVEGDPDGEVNQNN